MSRESCRISSYVRAVADVVEVTIVSGGSFVLGTFGVDVCLGGARFGALGCFGVFGGFLAEGRETGGGAGEGGSMVGSGAGTTGSGTGRGGCDFDLEDFDFVFGIDAL